MRRNFFFHILILFLTFVWVNVLPTELQANRPFWNDDGAIAGVGEFELLLWVEAIPGDGFLAPVGHLEGAYTFMRGFEFTLGGGAGRGMEGSWTVVNPSVELKTLFASASQGRPGIALTLGVLPPFGFGEGFVDGTTLFALLPMTFELPGDQVAIHASLGWVSLAGEDGFRTGRPLAGLGIEWAIGGGDRALIGEVFAGDPGDAGSGQPSDFVDGPFFGQVGLR